MDDQNILFELFSFVDAGEHTKFELLQNWESYRVTRKIRYARRVLIRYLQELADNQLRSYCDSIVTGTTTVYSLLAYVKVTKAIEFYTEELRIAEDILDEYETYLLSGNWTDFIFNLQRPIDKLWDHRGK